MQVDASLNKQVADVRQFQITLTPTARATNQVQLSGQVDMSQTNAIQGNLKLVADSLDFTSYYDLFMGGKQAPATRGGDHRAARPRPRPRPQPRRREPTRSPSQSSCRSTTSPPRRPSAGSICTKWKSPIGRRP